MLAEMYGYNVPLAISMHIGRTQVWLPVNLLIDRRML